MKIKLPMEKINIIYRKKHDQLEEQEAEKVMGKVNDFAYKLQKKYECGTISRVDCIVYYTAYLIKHGFYINQIAEGCQLLDSVLRDIDGKRMEDIYCG